MKASIVLIPVLLAGAVAAGCADLTPPGYSETPRVSERIEYGVVDHIDLYHEGSGTPTGLRVGDRVRVVNGRAYRA